MLRVAAFVSTWGMGYHTVLPGQPDALCLEERVEAGRGAGEDGVTTVRKVEHPVPASGQFSEGAKLGRAHVVFWLAAILLFYVPLAAVVKPRS